MLNWSSLGCVILTPLAGALGGMMGAMAARAGPLMVALFTSGGFVLGIGVGAASFSLASALLSSKRLNAGVQFPLYLLVPLLSVAIAASGASVGAVRLLGVGR